MCCYKQTQTDWGRGGRSFVCVEEVRVVLEHEGGHDRRRGEHRAGRGVRLVAPVVAPGAAGAPGRPDHGRRAVLLRHDVAVALVDRDVGDDTYWNDDW